MSDGRTAPDLLEALGAPFPREAIKTREGGRGMQLSYVETETVIRRLNRVAGAWDFRITDKVWREFEYVDRNGQARHNIVLTVFGEMTIPGLGTRAGTGVQIIEDGRGGEDMVKGAASDCLKKCATLFGVGLELYGPDIEAGELPDPPRPRQEAPRSPQPPERPSQGSTTRHEGNGGPPPAFGASDKQINYIRALAKAAGITMIGSDGQEHCDEVALTAKIEAQYQERWPNLSKGVASKLIEELRA